MSENILLSFLNNQIETLENFLNEKNEKNNLKILLLQLKEESFSKNQEFKLHINQLEENIKFTNLSKEDFEIKIKN